MIISASRRTDLPAAYPEWLYRRFREGWAESRNPMNPRQVKRVSLRREDVEGVVFWTKNPEPMLSRLSELDGYNYCFQYTLTGYDRDTEANLPPHRARIDTFLRLAERIGPERVLWRYDPILLNPRYAVEWHLRAFERLIGRLNGATQRVTISFVDVYARNKRRLEALGAQTIDESAMRLLAAEMARMAARCGMETVACSESIDLTECGVKPAACVDAALLSRLGGYEIPKMRDKGQRGHCGCAPSVDIGVYNTCPNGCVYCYANYSPTALRENLRRRHSMGPLLCSGEEGEDMHE